MKTFTFMAISTHMLMLTGCASTSTLEWLRDDHAEAIAEDLAVAVATRVPPSDAPVFVAAMPLRDHFENAMRAHGYALATDPDEAIEISGLGERIPPNTWHVGLDVDDGIRIHRLYRIDQSEVQALSSISVGNHPRDDEPQVFSSANDWQMRSLHTARSLESKPPAHSAETVKGRNIHVASRPAAIQRSMTQPRITPIERSASAEIPFPPTAPTPDAFDVSERSSADGAVFTFTIGSLKQNLVDALAQRGWTVTAWPNDTQNERLIVDWIVTRETSVNVSSVENLLAGLRATYGLNATVDVLHREIAFSMDGDL